MPEKIGPINQIEQKKDRLSQVLETRRNLFDLIGTGEVKAEDSFENAIKVGRVRAAVKASIVRIQEKHDGLNLDLDAYNQACDHRNQVSIRQTQLSQINQMVTDGNLSPNIFHIHEQRLQELISLSQTDPTLIRGIELIRLEEEAKREINKPLEEIKKTEIYKLPNGQEVRGKFAQILCLLEGSSSNNPLTSDQITQTIWPNTNNDIARNRLGELMSRFRANFKNSGLDIIVISDHSERLKGQKGKYYLETLDQSIQTPTSIDFYQSDPSITGEIKNEIVYRQISEPSSLNEKIAFINRPEYGTLSRADISAIAFAIILYTKTLEPILEASNIQLIDQSTLTELQNLTEDIPLANFSNMTTEEHCQFANQFRIKALEKARTLIDSPNMNQILDDISAQNTNVWCLLVNLSEMDKVNVRVWNETIVKKGITFLTDLLANPEARKQGFSIENKPINIPKPSFDDTNTAELQDAPQIPLSETLKVEDAPIPAITITPELPKTERKLKAIEVYDPTIRTKINDFLDQILEHPELLSAASSAMITRAFPRLKQKTIEQIIETNFISIEQGRDGKNKFGPTGIISLLYLHEFGKNLPNRLKKQIEDIATEEYGKRQNK